MVVKKDKLILQIDGLIKVLHSLIFIGYFALNLIFIGIAWFDLITKQDSINLTVNIILFNIIYISFIAILQSFFGDCPLVILRRKVNSNFRKSVKMLWKIKPTVLNRLALFSVAFACLAVSLNLIKI